MDLKPLHPSETAAYVALWNAAFPAPFHIDAALWEHATWRSPGFVAEDGVVAWQGRVVIGLAVTKLWRPAALPGLDATQGHISALVIHPQARRQGRGSRLLAWAEDRLRRQEAQRVVVGRDIQPLLCGVPEASGSLPFFMARGYQATGQVWDTARDLANYTPHPEAVAAQQRLGPRLDIRPASHRDAPGLLAFLAREFPGRWHYETSLFLTNGGPPEDIIVLCLDGVVQGFAHIHPPFTTHLAYGTNWRRALPQPAGGLGPIGVAAAMRGEGLGLALLDGGLQVLAERGTRGCVIDWTTLVDFYGKVGFQPWLAYDQVERRL